MKEFTITTNKIVSAVGTSIDIWRWEVPVYLFLGGLAAGILVLASIMIILNRSKEFPLATNRIIAAVPVVMSLGMFALFLDLSHKLYVWRFYTAFRITSVMSWGAWILLLVYPFSLLLILGTLREGFPEIYKKLYDYSSNLKSGKYAVTFNNIIKFSEKYKNLIAKLSIPVGIMLGIYTGILLSAFIARPFWNSAILGPLFLVSGLSTGAAIIILFSKNHEERTFFTKVDLTLIGSELVILILFIIGMATSTGQHREAVKLIMGGALTPVFWIFIFIFGLLIPALLEVLELRGKNIPGAIAASLVLLGGLLLRFIFVEAGQISTWLPY